MDDETLQRAEAEARKEIEQERFNALKEQIKQQLLSRKTLRQRLFPWTIKIVRI